MPNQEDVLEGTPIPGKRADLRVGAAEAFNALNLIVGVVRDSIQVHETESTKREKLRAYRETEIARIRASEAALRDYFDRIFEERRENHNRLFASLDRALESGDVAAIQSVVGGIVEVARTSPLADIGNLSDLRRAMDDPNTVFEL
ncbi:hypothetical protein Q2K19_12525 [Micromonospora soli]|uniref:hypothetical protein n=1 Tax=Micromonospora sp. NBRC 110009 TaxID=3061627 RepID=UPI002671B553|nr:hypothetical protein [Micromonospora sp. NBRC 110009]WKU01226.1 hypothetical protein Q2K19_12525 [Micromonospora sp. NBRC 110009]